MEERTFCVYMHTNKINGKKYIGQTCQVPEYRWGTNGNKYNRSPHFYNAIQKYGWDNFLHEVLFENLSADEANTKEIELIEFYQTMDDDFGYNLRSGGSGGEFTERTQEKNSRSTQRQNTHR